MKKGRYQAKDIPDLWVLENVAKQNRERPHFAGAIYWEIPMPFEVQETSARKLMLAKCGALLRRRFVDGCDCGCRGDFKLTDAGEAELARLRERA